MNGKVAFVINTIVEGKNPRVSILGRDIFLEIIEKVKKIAGGKEVFVVMDRERKGLFNDIKHEVNVIAVEKNTTIEILTKIQKKLRGFDLFVYIFSDEPLFDIELTKKLLKQHVDEFSDYSYGEGFLPGAVPEIISIEILPKLISLIKDRNDVIKRGTIFELISRDINSFDIESIFPDEDIRLFRIELTTSKKVNRIFVERIVKEKGFKVAYPDICDLVLKKPELVRTVPTYIEVEITGKIDNIPVYFPVSQIERERNDMPIKNFMKIVDSLSEYSEEFYIAISYLSEPLLHPNIKEIIEGATKRQGVHLIVETDGTLFDPKFSNFILALNRSNIHIIFRIDAIKDETYRKIYGKGDIKYPERNLRYLISRGFKNVYAQMVRMNINEDELIDFYDMWSKEGAKVIIQKYNDFLGVLPELSYSDLRPLEEVCCYHLMRDLVVFSNGDVPKCKQDINGNFINGNVFVDGIEKVWDRGKSHFINYCMKNIGDDCKKCDEYYIFNF